MNCQKMFAGLLACLNCLLLLPVSALAAEPYSLGDLNGDGLVNATDAALILEAAASVGSEGTSVLTAAQLAAADADSDGCVEATDACAVLAYAAACGTGDVTASFQDHLVSNSTDSSFSELPENATIGDRINAVKLVSRNAFTVYNKQSAETSYYLKTLTENDIAILEQFAAAHFPADATREEQLWITLQWIHQNVAYAYEGELWNSIADKTWVEAIFVHQKGQCAQYNGAMAAMMAWLGYDVCVVQGYRGTWPGSYWQHFWTEVNLGGTAYVMECGNYGKNGNWYYFLNTYDETKKYICNEQNMS